MLFDAVGAPGPAGAVVLAGSDPVGLDRREVPSVRVGIQELFMVATPDVLAVVAAGFG